jgi:hypothetical protein
MVNYKCLRCGYTNRIKSIFIKHLNRKFTCQPILEHLEPLDIYTKYFGNNKILVQNKYAPSDTEMTPKSPKMTPKKGKMTPKSPKMHQNSAKDEDINNIIDEDIYVCNNCDKKFKHKRSLKRHIISRCKQKNDLKDVGDIKTLVKLINKKIHNGDNEDMQIVKLMGKMGLCSDAKNINNIQNIIQVNINPFNKTDLSHLTDADYLSFLKHANFCVPFMIQKIHFDPEKPENHNVYISNLKKPYVSLHNGKRWDVHDREEVIEDILDDMAGVLDDKVTEWENNGLKDKEPFKFMIKKFDRFIEKRDLQCISNKLKKEIKFILFNNRHIIKNKR